MKDVNEEYENEPLKDDDDVSVQAYARMVEEPQGIFVLTRGWDDAKVKEFRRSLGRLLTSYCQGQPIVS